MAVKAQLVESGSIDDIESPVPGTFEYFQDSNGRIAGMTFICPCGCGSMYSMSFDRDNQPRWVWDENRLNPTLQPSVNIKEGHWHGWLSKGWFTLNLSEIP